MNNCGLLIVGGGSAKRYGSDNKLLEMLGEVPLFIYSMRRLGELFAPSHRIFVAPPDELEIFKMLAEKHLPQISFTFVAGGEKRAISVQNGLSALPKTVEFIAIHDAARPLTTRETLTSTLNCAISTGAAIPGHPITDTLKQVNSQNIIENTVDRSCCFAVSTPQCFNLKLLLKAYKKAINQDFTDDAGIMEYLSHPVSIVVQKDLNPKITYAKDLPYLEYLLNAENK